MGQGKNMATASVKRVRTCIVCGAQQGKNTLYRVVRSPQGDVSFDETGRASGRGAYVCSAACLDRACKTKRLDRALKMKVSDQDLARVVADMRDAISRSEVM